MLPKDADERAAGFERLSPERKKELLDHIRSTPPKRQRSTINTIITNGGSDGEFVTHVLGKEAVESPAAKNKKVNPAQTK